MDWSCFNVIEVCAVRLRRFRAAAQDKFPISDFRLRLAIGYWLSAIGGYRPLAIGYRLSAIGYFLGEIDR
jgi:hypothetical protein